MSKRTKPTLILGGLLSVLVAGCGAEPAEVCKHVEEIVTKEAGAEAAKEAVDGCEFTWQMRKDTKGIFQYKESADCVMDAQNLDQLAKCG
jgi:hypothetical protein